ncbi:MAG TPA: cation diffusion facilitator family transporter [Miltoncostaeaceae bacterium]|nr:cation diffusion facilitator family transporter [Miltoncostaeaceae bacterium]
MHEGSKRAIFAAFLANLGIAIAKFVGFLITGASSMLAESIHSLADTTNQGLLFHGGRQAARPATPEHPFGYGRDRYFWSFVVALVLFSIGGLFAVYEGVDKLRHPHDIDSPAVAFVILGVAVVLEAFSLRTAIRESNHVRGSLSWTAFVRRSKSPELPVVLLEDLGALFGLFFAIAGLTLAVTLDEPRWDGVATIAIGVLLVTIAVILVVEMKSLLIGESASGEQQRAILGAIEETQGVRRLIHMRTLHLGPDELLVAAKVELAGSLSVREVAEAIDAAEGRVRSAVPIARVIYLEPDLFDATEAAEPGPA